LTPMSSRTRSIWLGRVLRIASKTHRIDGRANKGYRLVDIQAA
jgi:hypothetical protein